MIPIRTLGSFLLVLAGAAVTAGAADEAPRDVPRVAAPRLDGRLDDDAWVRAVRVDDFVARTPVDGAAPSQPTTAWLACTERALFVAVRAHESLATAIRASTLRRDDFAITGDDQFVIVVDSFRDRHSGYWFSTNPLGVRVDAQFSNEGARFHDDWNGLWDVAVRRDSSGWSAEFEIPWATMRFRESNDVVMGINLFRRIARRGERLYAPPIPLELAYGTMNVSVATPYRFRGIAGGARVDLRPFSTAATRRDRGRPVDDRLDAGFSARMPLSDAATVTVTARADFAEVEADDPRLNLTRFPLFVPEKRDFFLEGAGLFAFGVPGEAELFFSRSIGIVPGAGDDRTARVDWGIKGSGQRGPLEIGVLAGETAPVDAHPGDRFDVARARLAPAARTSIGALWTRRRTFGEDHLTFGADASHVLPREVTVEGFVARDGRGAQASDAWYAAVSRGGERASFALAALDLGPGFAPALGLVARPGSRKLHALGALPWFDAAASPVRRWIPSAAWTRWDDDDGGATEQAQLGFTVEWKAGPSLQAQAVRVREELVAGFAPYRDAAVAPGTYDGWEGGLMSFSPDTRPFRGSLEARAGDFYDGRHALGRVEAAWYPGRHVFLEPSVVVDRVALPARRFTAWAGALRLGLTASTRLRLDLLARHESARDGTGLGARVRYDFAESSRIVVAWDRTDFEEFGAPPGTPRRRDDRGAIKGSWLVRF